MSGDSGHLNEPFVWLGSAAIGCCSESTVDIILIGSVVCRLGSPDTQVPLSSCASHLTPLPPNLAIYNEPTTINNNKLPPPPTLLALALGKGRRIKTEERAKAVAFVWGTEFIQFLAALGILQKGDFEE